VAKEKELHELIKTLPPDEAARLQEKHDKEVERQRKRRETERLKEERLERIKKRRFPMEDTRLHAEDKELGVKPPSFVKRRPGLPYFFQLLERHNKNTASGPSKCDQLDYDSRGLVTDLLQVYHFFRGDVSYNPNGEEDPLVPEFSLKQLIYAVDEVLNGNAKKTRMVPPLISHLFVTCLKLVTSPPMSDDATPAERQFHKDLKALSIGLSPVSWGDVCCLYMDVMERYMTCSASMDPNVVKPGKTDVAYLMKMTDAPDLSKPLPELPEGYEGYLGNANSALARGQAKLLRYDPWTLTAEELMALLRALTDDVLACRPEIGEDLAQR
jgi:hypothetical protein